MPADKPDFHFSYGINQDALDKGGDGVDFFIDVQDDAGATKRLFSNYIDPKHNAGERRWMDGQIDLSGYRGKSVTLLFSTGPGPKGDPRADWAGWSNLSFGPPPVKPDSPFVPVYNNEVKISEYDDVLPRATLYYQAELKDSPREVLNRLADPS